VKLLVITISLFTLLGFPGTDRKLTKFLMECDDSATAVLHMQAFLIALLQTTTDYLVTIDEKLKKIGDSRGQCLNTIAGKFRFLMSVGQGMTREGAIQGTPRQDFYDVVIQRARNVSIVHDHPRNCSSTL
jgi:hypothetical protein